MNLQVHQFRQRVEGGFEYRASRDHSVNVGDEALLISIAIRRYVRGWPREPAIRNSGRIPGYKQLFAVAGKGISCLNNNGLRRLQVNCIACHFVSSSGQSPMSSRE